MVQSEMSPAARAAAVSDATRVPFRMVNPEQERPLGIHPNARGARQHKGIAKDCGISRLLGQIRG